jgi:predicted permease
MLPIFSTSFFCVLRVFLVCLAGVWLVHRGVMTREFRMGLSRLVAMLMLPALLVTKIGGAVDVTVLRRLIFVPGTALIYILCGFLIGWLVMAVARPPVEHRRLVLTACTFGNSGYIPIPLVLAIAGSASLFANDPQAGARGVMYISIYLVCMSPCMWGIGYPVLAGKPLRSLRWSQIISPPFLSSLTGILIGCVPFLHNLFVTQGAPLRVLFDTGEFLGKAAVPCALLVLGANLADRPKADERATLSTVLSVAWGRLVLLPLIGCVVTLGLWRWGLIPHDDPMLVVVLLIEASVPSATNLVVMCQLHGRGEAAMSRILVASYLLAVPTMTAFVGFFLWIAERL